MAICTECKADYTLIAGKCEENGIYCEFNISEISTFIFSTTPLPPSLSVSPPLPLPPSTGDTSASTSTCGTGCIIGIVLAILGAIILSIVVVLVVYAVYRYLSNPATKLAKAGTEGLNG